VIKIKLKNAVEKLESIVNKPFSDFLTKEEMESIRINKGLTGQLLEIQLGLQNKSTNLDFEDGELKTNKVDINGKPLETMYIKQISNMVDEILERKKFLTTELYYKIKNILYVPVYKGNRKNRVHRSKWKLLPYIHFKLGKFPELKTQLKNDYYTISKKMNKQITEGKDGHIHTCNGELIQIRTKDSKPYHPIYSEKYERYISDKNYAFYFKKDFMMKLQKLSPKYPLD